MALPASIPDSQLGLNSAEITTLRHHQSIALAAAPSTASHYSQTSSNHSRTPSTAYSYASSSTRGRGTQRSSGPSSRAASAASSAGGGGHGRLLLDAGSLSVLGAYFERLMVRIQERVDYLTAQTTITTTTQSRSAAATMAAADAEIARFKDILRQIDDLETEFDKIRHIRDIVKGYRARVESVSRGLDRRR